MASSSRGCLQDLFEWLFRINVIDQTEMDDFINDVECPSKFLEELRCGQVLAKLAMIALPEAAPTYRQDMCLRRLTW